MNRLGSHMLSALVAFALFPSFADAGEKEISSGRSEITLKANPAGGGLILVKGTNGIAIIVAEEGQPGAGKKIPVVIMPPQFPYSVSFDLSERNGRIGEIIVSRPFSKSEKSQLIDCVEIAPDGSLRFASDEVMAGHLRMEAQGKEALKQLSSELNELATSPEAGAPTPRPGSER